jgi:hypothetical protein
VRIVSIEAAYLQRVLDALELLSPLACSEEIAVIKESLKARPVAQVQVVDCHQAGVCVQSGLRAERQGSSIAAQLAVPEGMKLVPVEPTDKMVQAAYHLDLSYMPGQEGADRAAIYRAMLTAAPEKGQP